MPLDTAPYRSAMERYRREHGLAPEKGFTIQVHGPLLLPGRRLLLRVQKHMVALKKNGKRVYPKVKVTGLLDKPTRTALVPPISFGEKVAATALSQQGVHETPWGSNDGHQVRVYQSTTGAYRAPWCASFVSWCKRMNGYDGPVSASAYAWGAIGTRVELKNAKPGDAVVFAIGQGHIGIYLSHDSNSVRTCDGNTSNQVAIRDRSIHQIHSITRQH